MLFALPFPIVDRVAFAIGPVSIQWYGLAYLAGILGATWLASRLLVRENLWLRGMPPIPSTRAYDAMGWIALGLVVGGRLGYVLFYAPAYHFAHPLEIFAIWKGGMSFHGGCLGATLAAFWFTRRLGGSMLGIADLLACVAPVGLFLGRIANFVNGELWGRASDVPWAMVFPAEAAGGVPRHPSQLYEAALEGLGLFLLLLVLSRWTSALRHPGVCCGAFLAGYGSARIVVENFREPDAGVGFIVALGHGGVTMGMLLSLPMLLGGIGLIVWALRRRSAP